MGNRTEVFQQNCRQGRFLTCVLINNKIQKNFTGGKILLNLWQHTSKDCRSLHSKTAHKQWDTQHTFVFQCFHEFVQPVRLIVSAITPQLVDVPVDLVNLCHRRTLPPLHAAQPSTSQQSSIREKCLNQFLRHLTEQARYLLYFSKHSRRNSPSFLVAQ